MSLNKDLNNLGGTRYRSAKFQKQELLRDLADRSQQSEVMRQRSVLKASTADFKRRLRDQSNLVVENEDTNYIDAEESLVMHSEILKSQNGIRSRYLAVLFAIFMSLSDVSDVEAGRLKDHPTAFLTPKNIESVLFTNQDPVSGETLLGAVEQTTCELGDVRNTHQSILESHNIIYQYIQKRSTIDGVSYREFLDDNILKKFIPTLESAISEARDSCERDNRYYRSIMSTYDDIDELIEDLKHEVKSAIRRYDQALRTYERLGDPKDIVGGAGVIKGGVGSDPKPILTSPSDMLDLQANDARLTNVFTQNEVRLKTDLEVLLLGGVYKFNFGDLTFEMITKSTTNNVIFIADPTGTDKGVKFYRLIYIPNGKDPGYSFEAIGKDNKPIITLRLEKSNISSGVLGFKEKIQEKINKIRGS